MYENYLTNYRKLFGTNPPDSVTIGSSAADILSPSRGFMTGFDFTMQLQVGCPGACLFCYVRYGSMLAPTSVRGPGGSQWGFQVRDKTNPVGKLAKHLASGKLADKSIYWSGVTDPYAASPKTTRGVWERLILAPADQRPLRIAVQTRFRPDRDAALMAEYGSSTQPADGGPAVLVSYSMGTDRDDLIRAWERATPVFEHRMQCIKNLRTHGVLVVATLSPFGLWNDLGGTVRRLEDMGVAYVTVLFLKSGTRSANTPKSFLNHVRENHPELLDEKWQEERLGEIREVFGAERVLVGQEGFASLTRPHLVSA